MHYLIKILMLSLPFSLTVRAQDTYQWRDENGVMVFSDRERGSTAVRDDLASIHSPTPKFLYKTDKAHRRKPLEHETDDVSEKVISDLSSECRWLRGRIAHLRQLSGKNKDSIFYVEMKKQQMEWKKERCSAGSHKVNRELTPARKVKIKKAD